MERIKLVVVFDDEESDENIDLLIEDLEETGLTEICRFDDNNKMIVEVNSEIPDPDHLGTLEDYWMSVINDSKCPCCHPIEETTIAVYSVMRLSDFQKNGNYSFLDDL